ncbi:interleukin-11 receptor subunit alpha [Anaeramoeba ignava]|uniref:Interleukin-11 receptor subunit alpha n=1 Tax=Anaeramoeba ignava TaxID=1746090 RepID=A0A9Q0RCM6_ANAIG|nr:interleukin-11 receptor subunit alpha [Anaeramoeba ignava]
MKQNKLFFILIFLSLSITIFNSKTYQITEKQKAKTNFHKIECIPKDFNQKNYQEKCGKEISVSKNLILIGFPEASIGNNKNQGKVYVYRKEGSNWNKEATLIASDGIANGYFGSSCSILEDDILLVQTKGINSNQNSNQNSNLNSNQNSNQNSNLNSNQNSVYLFKFNGKNWIESKIPFSNLQNYLNFHEQVTPDNVTIINCTTLFSSFECYWYNVSQDNITYKINYNGDWNIIQNPEVQDNTLYQIFDSSNYPNISGNENYTIQIIACDAEDQCGNSTNEVNLTTRIDSVKNLSAITLSSTSIDISWNYPNVPIIEGVPKLDHYAISYSLNMEEEVGDATINNSSTSYNLSNLNSGSNYSISIWACQTSECQGDSKGEVSTISNTTIFGQVNLSCSISDSFTIICSWDEPNGTLSPSFYNFSYQSQNGEDIGSLNLTITNETITANYSNEEYYIYVSACDINGICGDVSNTTVNTLIFGQVNNLNCSISDSFTIICLWDEPNGTLIPSSYNFTYQSQNGEDIGSLNLTITNETITANYSNEEYYIYVSACDINGICGDISNTTVNTLIFEQVNNLSCSISDSFTIICLWDEPNGTLSPSSYNFTYQSQNGEDIGSLNLTITNETITANYSDQEYYIYVSACDINGICGDISNKIVNTTIFGQVNNLNCSISDSFTIICSWNEPNGTLIPSFYNFTYQSQNGEDIGSFNLTITNETITANYSDQEYYIYVSACDINGICGNVSNTTINTTIFGEVNLSCSISDSFTIICLWDKPNGTLIPSFYNFTYQSQNGEDIGSLNLTITNETITANYSDQEYYIYVSACDINGICGNVSNTTVTTTIFGEVNLSCSISDSFTIICLWDEPNGTLIPSFYNFTYQSQNGEDIGSFNLTITNETITANYSNEEYYIYVSACDINGICGNVSNTTVTTTIFGQVNNLNCSISDSFTISCSWDKPNGTLIPSFYNFSYQSQNGEDNGSFNLTSTNETITANYSNEEYYIYVSACDINGICGNVSNTTVTTTIFEQVNLSCSISDSFTISCSWDKPNGTLIPSFYSFSYQSQNGEDNGSFNLTSTNETITANYSNEEYQINVSACDINGICGDISTKIVTTSIFGPVNLSCSISDSFTISCSWDKPDGTLIPSFYSFSYQSQNGEDNGSFNLTSTNETITANYSNEEYQINVSACDINNHCGDISTKIVTTTIFEKVNNLNCSISDSFTIICSWDKPNGTLIPSFYNFTYQSQNGEDNGSLNFTLPNGNTTAIYSNEEYYIYVSACDINGICGNVSNTTVTTTIFEQVNNLNCSISDSFTIICSWDEPNGTLIPSFYNFSYQSQNGEDNGSLNFTLTNGNTTANYSNEEYYIYVSACDINGICGNVSNTTITTTIFEKVNNLNCSISDSFTIICLWDKPNGTLIPSFYNFTYQSQNGEDNGSLNFTLPNGNTTANYSNEEYYIYVSACDINGICGNISNTTITTTIFEKVNHLNCPISDSFTIICSWDKPNGTLIPSFYNFTYQSQNGEDNGSFNLTSTSETITANYSNEEYQINVSACDINGICGDISTTTATTSIFGPVNNLNCSISDSFTIICSWDEPDGTLSPSFYNFTYQSQNGEDNGVFILASTITNETITANYSNEEYYIYVSACDINGICGDISTKMINTTIFEKVNNLSCSISDSFTISCSWNKPNGTLSPSFYNFSYQSQNGEDNGSFNLISTITNETITANYSNEEYQINVSACDINNKCGDVSNIIITTSIFGQVNLSCSISDSFTIICLWDKPNGTLIPSFYNFTYQSQNGEDNGSFNLISTITNETITANYSNEEYYIYVSACDINNKCGDVSNVVVNTTIFEQVNHLNCSISDSFTIICSWDKPNGTLSPSFYNFTYQSQNGEDIGSFNFTLPNGNTTAIYSNEEYYIYVSACDINGICGNVSNITINTTIFEKVNHLNCSISDSFTIICLWDKPNGTLIPSFYNFSYQSQNGEDIGSFNLAITNETITANYSNEEYYIYVSACDINGICGDVSTKMITTTIFEKVNNLSCSISDSFTISCSWDEPNGTLIPSFYNFTYQSQNGEDIGSFNLAITNETITANYSNEEYYIYVSACDINGICGDISNITINTLIFEKVNNLSCSISDSFTIICLWDKPNGTLIPSFYNFSYQSQNGEDNGSFNLAITNETITANYSNEEYYINVSACDINGICGDISNITINTLIFEKVNNLSCSISDSFTISCSWDEPNGTLIPSFYNFSYQSQNGEDNGSFNLAITNETITANHSNEEYYINVSACDINGICGDISNTTIDTLIFGPVNNLSCSVADIYEIICSWDKPNGTLSPSFYNFTYQSQNNQDLNSINLTSTNEKITANLANEEYYINVSACDMHYQCGNPAETLIWTQNEPSTSNSKTVIITISVIVPVFIISLIVVIVLLQKRKRKRNDEKELIEELLNNTDDDLLNDSDDLDESIKSDF